jgi:DNA-binding NtrC family response regulator
MATPEQNRILIVDDDPSIRRLMARHFSRKGFQVEQAKAAEEVLDRFGGTVPPFDVVLTDVHLPGQSGVDLARRIKLAQPDQAVVFMTGDADAAIARQALRSGASSFLLKPFQFFEIDTAVRNALQRKVGPDANVQAAGSPKPRRRASVKVRVRVAAVVAVMLLLGWMAGAGFDSPAKDSAEPAASAKVATSVDPNF